MRRERLSHNDPIFDTRSAIQRLLAGVTPKQIFGLSGKELKITYGAIDADFTQQDYRGSVDSHVKAIINTLRTAACETLNDRIASIRLKSEFPADSALVKDHTLESLTKRATDAFDLINPNVHNMQLHPDETSVFERTRATLEEYFLSPPNLVRDKIFIRVISERHTRERLPAYIELLTHVYKRDMGSIPTVKILRQLMFSSLPIFTKPTRFDIAYFSAVNEYASVPTGIFTRPFKFENDAFFVTRNPRLSVVLKPEIEKLIAEEYKKTQTFTANQLLTTGCPANKTPQPGSETDTSLVMTILHKTIIPGF